MKLATHHARQGKESAATEHLLTGGEKRGGVHLRFDRINRTHGPKKGRAKQNEHPDSRTTGFVRPKIQGGSDQNSDTEETTCEAEPDDGRRLRRSAHRPGEKSHVDGHGCHHHRGETRRNVLFRESDTS